MTPDQALVILAQMAQDLIATLPASAKAPTFQAAQQAIDALKSKPPAETTAP